MNTKIPFFYGPGETTFQSSLKESDSYIVSDDSEGLHVPTYRVFDFSWTTMEMEAASFS